MFICEKCALKYYVETDDGGITPLTNISPLLPKSMGKCEICGEQAVAIDVEHGMYFDYQSEHAIKYNVFNHPPIQYGKAPKLSQGKWVVAALKRARVSAEISEIDGRPYVRLLDRVNEPFGSSRDVQLRGTFVYEVQVACSAKIMNIDEASDFGRRLDAALRVAVDANKSVYDEYKRILDLLEDRKKGLVTWQHREDSGWPGGTKTFIEDYRNRINYYAMELEKFVEAYKEDE